MTNKRTDDCDITTMNRNTVVGNYGERFGYFILKNKFGQRVSNEIKK